MTDANMKLPIELNTKLELLARKYNPSITGTEMLVYIKDMNKIIYDYFQDAKDKK